MGRAPPTDGAVLHLRTLNLVRERPDVQLLKSELLELGADWVFTEAEFAAQAGRFLARPERRPALALDGVGGRSALLLADSLARDGLLLVYGGMSRRPHQLSSAALLQKGVSVAGFQLADFFQERHEPFRRRVYDRLQVGGGRGGGGGPTSPQALALAGRLHAPPTQTVPLERFGEALAHLERPGAPKQLLIISDDNRAKI